jgi:4-amino-4-deoxy-L-arabinose transferase-like glycosyltransferase
LVSAIAIFLYSSIIPNTPFISDESVYAYASYAIARGVVPYREIYLAHPPLMFYIYAFFIKLFGANIYCLRLITSVIYLFTGLLAYLVIKGILRDHMGGVCKLGLIYMCLYVFLPMQIPFFTTIIVEPVFTLFTLASLVLYIMHYSHLRSRIFLFLAGIFMGLAVMIKLTAILFIVSMLIYHAVTYLREDKKLFNTLFIFLGIAIPCFFVLIWVSVWCHALEQFYLDLFYWPMVRIPTTLAEKLGNLTWYVEAFLPLLLTGALGAVFSAWKAKNERNSLFMLPVWLYGSR